MLKPSFSLTDWDSSLPSTPRACLFVMAVLIVRLISQHYHHHLHKYPGPFLASLTDFWRLCHAYRNRNREPMIHMHDKYGDVVRMGPNVLSFRQPQAIKDIYGPKKHFKKSGYYPVNAAVAKGQMAHTLFSSPDQNWHNKLRRSIGANFTMNSAVKFEILIENTISAFLEKLDEKFAGREGDEGIVSFHTWLLYFAFDVMGDLTYSARHGFIAQERDMFNIISYVKDFLNYGFIAGQMPTADIFLRHNPLLMWLERREFISSSTFPGVPIAVSHMRKRLKHYKDDEEKRSTDREDLLDKFLTAQRKQPEVVTEQEVLGLSLSMMIAGSETTAITLTAFFYHLLRAPACYAKLQSELDTHLLTRDTASTFITVPFCNAYALPYLFACVQETFRLHPAFGFNYERVVPPSGATICNRAIPAGTIVGVNPWVVQRDRDVFGDDAEAYRPERWLSGDAERVKEMEKTMFQFGAGDHICLGKNISAVEIYKLVPALMRNFEMALVDPEREWKLINGANVRMSDVDIRIRRR